MNDLLNKAAEIAGNYLLNRQYNKVTDDMRTENIKDYIEKYYDFCNPANANEVLEDIAYLLQKGCINTSHPAYFGLFNPGVPSCAISASTIVTAINPQLGAFSHGRSAVLIEQHILSSLAKMIGYNPNNLAAHFTNGGQESNLEAIVVSLSNAFPQIREDGLFSIAGKPVLYVSEEAHHSFEKAAHMAGIGRNAVRRVPIDDSFKMDLNSLKKMILKDKESGFLPFLVAGTAGSTTTGSIDPLYEIHEICKNENLWFHCDAAWGGTALLSNETKQFFRGIENADSISWDAHKWLQMPFGTGMFFSSNPESLRQTFSTESSYMPPRGAYDDLYNVSLQWSRRGAGIPLFATFAIKGIPEIVSMVENMIHLGKQLSERLKDTGFSIINNSPLPVICFSHPLIEKGKLSAKDAAKSVARSGVAWIAPVELPGGKSVLRACICNHLTGNSDVETLMSILENTFA